VKDAKTVLEEFCDIAESRCAFSLKSGVYYEGYIIEIDNRHLRFGEGGPMAAVEPLLIPVQDVDLLSLAYWDENCERYMDAKWNDEQDKWIFQPSNPVNQQRAASNTSKDTTDLGLI
jgi:hypothetical protein